MAEIRVGCSGFSYSHWKEPFYPAGLAQRKWLGYYSTVFSTVELNVTFYRLPLAAAFEKWWSETPPDFAFSLKGSRFITHIKRLLDPEEPLKLFFERATGLREKFRVVLWQFSPAFKKDLARLRDFLKLLKRHPVRATLEFRHESWITEDVFDLCRDHNVSLCMADWPEFIDDLPVTADFVYLRRHGHEGNYASSYSAAALMKDAERIREYLSQGKDVFIYFNNDAYGHAPRNARELTQIIHKLLAQMGTGVPQSL